MRRVGRPGTWLLGAVITLMALSVSCGGPTGFGGHRDRHDAMHGGSDSRDEAVVEASGSTGVAIANNSFSPGNLRVTAGTTVTFTNQDRVAHTATADDQSWDTGLLGQGESASITFHQPGIFEYFCIPHPRMRARIEVVR